MIRVADHLAAEQYGAAVAMLPRGLRWLGTETDLFVGDPLFAGLHAHEITHDGRSYRRTMHLLYGAYVPDKRNTIVAPRPSCDSPADYVHELGHSLHAYIPFHVAAPEPVTDYAKVDWREGFAEWVCAWVVPSPHYNAARAIAERDEWSRELWNCLRRGAWNDLDNFRRQS